MANETYTLIQKTTVGSGGAASIEFTSIPQTFTDLVVRSSLRSDQANLYGSSTISLNNSTANFTYRFVYGEGATAASFSGSTNLSADQNGDTATANTFSNFDMYIPNYTSSNYKSISQDSVTENNGTTAYAELGALLWSNTAAITSIKLSPASTKVWKQYSSVSLYGVAKQGVNPVAGPKASGGDIITNDGTYWIHQFLNSGTFIPSQTLSTEYLVVAGGGGGGTGNDGAGGGGAGGYRTASGFSVTAQSYAITVGAGGTGASTANTAGAKGVDSVFSSITSTAGGGGGYSTITSVNDGGSGGGGAFNSSTSKGTGTVGQGNNGGTGADGGADRCNGGGGGASAVGGNASTTVAGNGGAGTASSISGTSVTYAGGGGGAANDGSTTRGTGGTGGGGNGIKRYGAAGSAGTANLGGGGGGGVNTAAGGTNGYNGGSGIVIIRYAI